jgi:DNA-binding MarR family transcriptional regulator
VTFLADRLEQRGLIQRDTDPFDRRVKLVGLTSAGVGLRTKILRAAATYSPLARLAQEDQRRLCDLLAKTRSAAEQASP